MSGKFATFLGTLAAAVAAQAAPATAQGPTPDPAPSVAAVPAAPAPVRPFKVGDTVVDGAGMVLGVVVGVGEGNNGAMSLIVKIDGKLISVPEAVLTLQRDRLVSSRSKAQLLAMAAAPS